MVAPAKPGCPNGGCSVVLVFRAGHEDRSSLAFARSACARHMAHLCHRPHPRRVPPRSRKHASRKAPFSCAASQGISRGSCLRGRRCFVAGISADEPCRPPRRHYPLLCRPALSHPRSQISGEKEGVASQRTRCRHHLRLCDSCSCVVASAKGAHDAHPWRGALCRSLLDQLRSHRTLGKSKSFPRPEVGLEWFSCNNSLGGISLALSCYVAGCGGATDVHRDAALFSSRSPEIGCSFHCSRRKRPALCHHRSPPAAVFQDVPPHRCRSNPPHASVSSSMDALTS